MAVVAERSQEGAGLGHITERMSSGHFFKKMSLCCPLFKVLGENLIAVSLFDSMVGRI